MFCGGAEVCGVGDTGFVEVDGVFFVFVCFSLFLSGVCKFSFVVWGGVYGFLVYCCLFLLLLWG